MGESRVNDDGTEIWSIITDRNFLIKKIKQALRDDKQVRRKKNSASSASLLSDSTSTILGLGSSFSTPPPPSHANNGHYEGARISYLQEELNVNNGSSSVLLAPLPNLSASMPPTSTLTFTVSPQGYASKDFSSPFSSITLNPCGYNN